MTIYKIILEVTDRQTVSLPSGFKVLTVQIQKGNLCLWVMVDYARPPSTHTIFIVSTGYPCDHVAQCDYIGTVQDNNFVWHVFID